MARNYENFNNKITNLMPKEDWMFVDDKDKIVKVNWDTNQLTKFDVPGLAKLRGNGSAYIDLFITGGSEAKGSLH